MLSNDLFQRGGLDEWLQKRADEAVVEVHQIDPDKVLATPPSDLTEQLTRRWEIEPLLLLEDQASRSEARDTKVDVRHDQNRFIGDRNRPALVNGTQVTFTIPYEGDMELWWLRTNPYDMGSVPSGDVAGGALRLTYAFPADSVSAESFQAAFEGDLQRLGVWLQRSAAQVARYNRDLPKIIEGAVQARRAKVLRDREIDAAIQVPLRLRPDRVETFAVDIPRKNRPVHLDSGKSTEETFQPEPTISAEAYAQLLMAIRSTTQVVERLPETFRAMPEESLRDVLLVVLNNQFGSATGETFSRRGKSDIHIAYHGGGDVFLAECKWWSGSSDFQKAISQLLDRYVVWRDTKVALVLFIRQKNVGAIIEKAGAVLQRHERFKRVEALPAYGDVYVHHKDGDTTREVQVALVAVPIPPD